MSDLDAFQRAFFADLLAAPGTAPVAALARQPGFAVYRNTVLRGCIDALAANYPTVHRLVGTEWFEETARRFAIESPPGDGVLAGYGAGFASFVEARASAEGLDVVPGAAVLDRCWTEAHLAADAPVLAAAELAAETPGAFASARLVPHPAARWACFASVPAFTVWRRHREGLAVDSPLDWRGECALLTRPSAGVAWAYIDAAAVAFLSACARKLCVARALDEAASVANSDEVVSWLPRMLSAGAFTRIERMTQDRTEP